MENLDRQEICKNIKSRISNLSQNEIEEIFKIIYKNNNNYSKNNNGIFINLSWLGMDTIIKIDNYINFCIKSHNEINKYEVICNMLNDSINSKDKQDENITENLNLDNNKIIINKQKISSSMKFYLLKKKFQKQQLTANIESYLTHDEYII
jgi:hypothetical protein